jgi:NAD(P)-dependent dehydrogenase (short-subunit alcohol dehydrogenase family)
MDVSLKPLEEQVIVVTGASSGIGLATARLAARRGARVVLASRSRTGLRRVVEEIRERGGEATWVRADVGDPDQVEEIAEHALREYGGFDTWVNNAGISIYGRLEDTALEDARRLFETNYWGQVHGSLVALRYLKEHGGALINVGSVVSERALPLQGHYVASKHAIKGFTDALRMELEKEGAPVSVTLIKPGSIDTPLPRHAKNLLEVEPTLPPPVYSPRVVARAILHCAERPVRDLVVGGGGKMIASMENTPRLADRYMEATMFRQQRTDHPRTLFRRDALHRARTNGEERGGYEGHVMKTSAYTGAVLHPVRTALAVALGFGAALALRGRGGGKGR